MSTCETLRFQPGLRHQHDDDRLTTTLSLTCPCDFSNFSFKRPETGNVNTLVEVHAIGVLVQLIMPKWKMVVHVANKTVC